MPTNKTAAAQLAALVRTTIDSELRTMVTEALAADDTKALLALARISAQLRKLIADQQV